MSGKRKSLPGSNDFTIVSVTLGMITCLSSGLCVVPFCLFSLKRMRPWLFFTFIISLFLDWKKMRSRADYLSWLNCSWLIKLQEPCVRVSSINQPWGT